MSWGWVCRMLVEMALLSCALTIACAIGLRLLRNGSATARHLLLTLATGLLIAMPLVRIATPGVTWSVPIAPTDERAARPFATTPPDTSRPMGANIRPERRAGQLGSGMEAAPASTGDDDNRMHTATTAAGSLPTPGARVTIAQCVAALWLAGFVVSLCRLAAGQWQVRRLRIGGKPASDGRPAVLVEECRKRFGIARGVRILVTSAPGSLPATWGFARPVVLLPMWLLSWPADRLRMVVLHEMAHIHRCDWPAQMVSQLACALYWFNPLVWRCCQQQRQECECACDDTVLLTGVSASDYASTLLEVLRNMKTTNEFSSAALAITQTPIEKRLRSILSRDGLQVRRMRAGQALRICLATAFCAMPLMVLRVQAAPRMEGHEANAALRPALSVIDDAGTGLRLAGQQARSTSDIETLRRQLQEMQRQLEADRRENLRMRQQIAALRADRASAGRLQNRSTDDRRAAMINEKLQKQAAEKNWLAQQRANKEIARQLEQARQKEALARSLELARQQSALAIQQHEMKARLDALQEVERLVQERYKAGQATRVEWEQARSAVAAAKSQLEVMQVTAAGIDASHRPASDRELLRMKMQLDLRKAEGELELRAEALKLATDRAKAGVGTNEDMLRAQAAVSEAQEHIAAIKLQLSAVK